MSKLWEPHERKALIEIVAKYEPRIARNKKTIVKEFRALFPKRSEEGVRAQLQIVQRAKQIARPNYNPIDVAFCKKITLTDIVRHYRDQGLRHTVHIVLELGE